MCSGLFYVPSSLSFLFPASEVQEFIGLRFGHVQTFTKKIMTYVGAVRVDGGGRVRSGSHLLNILVTAQPPVGGQLDQLLSSHKISNFFWCIFHTLWECGEPSFYPTTKYELSLTYFAAVTAEIVSSSTANAKQIILFVCNFPFPMFYPWRRHTKLFIGY